MSQNDNSRKNLVTRKGKFDAGHRVMFERFKCFNIHGHEYHYELTFSYKTPESIGYAIDFKEIKRVACEWIDERLDHGFIANPKDDLMIQVSTHLKSKLYVMHMADEKGFCNPSAENIAKELFFAVSTLMNNFNLLLEKVTLQETVNCTVTCEGLSTSEYEILMRSRLFLECLDYRLKSGLVEYDQRKV